MHLTPHETWNLLDSSKLQTYMRCPRRYFYRYILGWRPEGDSFHLLFGRAWHKAMEYLMSLGKPMRQVSGADLHGAFDAFYSVYGQLQTGSTEEHGGKTVEAAMQALADYIHRHKDDNFQVLMVEASGEVPITMDTWMTFRLDTVVRDDRGIFVLEHKTTSRNTRQWRDQWLLSVQVGLYTHVLYSLYEPDDVYGVVINGAVFRKTGIDFVRVPVRQTPSTMNVWWTTVRGWVAQLRLDMEALDNAKPEDDVLLPFRMNTTACTDFGGCPYADLCAAWPNPLRVSDEPPIGFIVDWWDPRAVEEESKEKLGRIER